MKRLMTSMLLSATLLAGATAYADPGNGSWGGGRDHIHFLAKKLDLTDEQKVAIEDIHSSYGKSRGKPHRNGFKNDFANLDPSSQDYSERVAQIAREQAAKVERSIIERGEIHAKVYQVLTPEQREKWQSLKEGRKEGHFKKHRTE